MSEAVLDSSAVLALLLNKPGADQVKAVLPGALMCTVNVAEVVTKLHERGMPVAEALQAIETIGIEMIDFTIERACATAALRSTTRQAGLSFGDRACLALAQLTNATALTADKAWGQLSGFGVVVIR